MSRPERFGYTTTEWTTTQLSLAATESGISVDITEEYPEPEPWEDVVDDDDDNTVCVGTRIPMDQVPGLIEWLQAVLAWRSPEEVAARCQRIAARCEELSGIVEIPMDEMEQLLKGR